MAVTTPRETWTDPRLDDLGKKVDDGFARVDKKMDEGFAHVDADIRELRGEMKSGFEKFDRKIDRLTWGLLAAAVAIVAALLGVIGALIGTNAF